MAKFKTRARAIDLLGRQQIAGIPTAINELFKNAHDAYADHVDVDYFRLERLFILRDDGLGMSKEDFENRWLVLGTESKFDNKRIPPPPIDPAKPKRPVMGEKGIGRLAISAIGKQMLIITRSKRNKELKQIVAALIHWGIFEIPGLDLDQVVIPLREFSDGKLPDDKDIESMKHELIDSIKSLCAGGILFDKESSDLIGDINNFEVNPEALDRKLPGNLSLTDHSGTHFYISPVYESLNFDIDGNPNEKESASKLEKFLIGFTDTMTPNRPVPNIEAAFRDYRGEDDTYFDLIDKDAFFTPAEFKMADHHFSGKFDQFGHFSGKISVYNQFEFEHTIPWPGNNFKKTVCGSFSIEISYVAGDKKQSYLDPINWSQLTAKLNRFGGLYLYKDGIRILPYGDTNYDFLDIEKNRSKSASYYFFSYRRILGVINISKGKNPNLVEKAGREGFIENKAYKQIREILKNFFVQLAADFFREKASGPYIEYWAKARKERERFYKAKEQREKRAKARKQKFTKELADFFTKAENNEFDRTAVDHLEDADRKFASVASIDDPDEAAQTLIDYETEARAELNRIRAGAKINAPRGFAISKDSGRDWEAYLDQYTRLEDGLFGKTEREIGELVNKYRDRLNLKISTRKRIEKALEQISDEAKTVTRKKRNQARSISEEMSQKVRQITQELMEALERKIREAQTGLSGIKLENVNDENLYDELKKFESPIILEKEYGTTVLENIINQIDSIYWEKDDTGKIVTNKDIEASLEEEIGELKEKTFNDIELVQLGLAVNIVHHEFNSAVQSLRVSIRNLKRWADIDAKLETTYKNIRTNFEHLDGYLSLLTPFNKRLYRKDELIEAEDIYIFLQDVFRGRLARHNIRLIRTKLFAATKLKGYRSVFYPVFVNIVDNAIHWLKQSQTKNEKVIRLHADKKGCFYISNTGPEIKEHDREKIFELGFTRKPEGRGMGLAISREVAESVGYLIFIDTPRKDCTVTFTICRKNT
jgi:signal transduction histidine kinase